MTEDVDCVVIGLGAIGSATCFALARAGVAVLGIEQFELGHARGASHDHSRIIRRSYHTPGYVELAGAAYDAWDRVPADQPLVVRTGGLDLFPENAAIAMGDYTSSMAVAGVPFEVLDAAEIMRRWPQWQLAPDVIGLFQADTGIVAAERATAALRHGAVEAGARLLGDTTVHSVRDDRGGVVVSTDAGEIRARRVVLAADAWTNELLAGLDWQVPLVVTQEQLTYTRPADLSQFTPGPVPGVDLDGRAQLVRLPGVRRAGLGQDRAGLRRSRGDRDPVVRPRPGRRGPPARVPRRRAADRVNR